MTPEIIARLTSLIQPGLVSGLGTATPGGMCIEAAISLATTGEFGDKPPCVAPADRAFAIAINDARWSSPQVRAEALLPLAIAQMGTAGADRTEWCRHLAEGTIRRVLPMALRAAASAALSITSRHELEAAAVRCELEGTSAAANAARHAADAARSVTAVASDVYAADNAYADDSAFAAAAAAADAAGAITAASANYVARRAAYAPAYSAASAYSAADAAGAITAASTNYVADSSAFAATGAAAASASTATATYVAGAYVYSYAFASAAADAALRLSVQVALDAYAATTGEGT